jgi:hypothetical protein
MHLLQLEEDDNVSLVRCDDSNTPHYAILSHTWGSDDEEVNFQDLADAKNPAHTDRYDQKYGVCVSDAVKSKPGYRKILFCGKQAAEDNLRYFWVDSCCIDKRSSQELTEAINSMYQWYQMAIKCYVYMSDVSKTDEFQTSRWFSRGWYVCRMYR